MPRPRSGSIKRRKTARGVSYGVEFELRGRRIYHHIGGEWDGWNESDPDSPRYVPAEVAHIARLIDRGEYVVPPRTTAPDPPTRSAPDFQSFASVWLARYARRIEGGEQSSTYTHVRWRLSAAIDHIGNLPLDQITLPVLEEMVDAFLQERAAIEEAAALGRPLMEPYVDARTGKTYQRPRRGLSKDSINKVIKGVRRVLKDAVRQGEITINVANDDELLIRRASRPNRSFLEVEQRQYLLRAARELEATHQRLTWQQVQAIRASDTSARATASEYGVSDTLVRKIRNGEIWTSQTTRNPSDIPREVIVAVLLFTGLRIEELCRLRGEHIDLAHGRIAVPGTKSEAAHRVIPILPALRERLIEHKMNHPYGLEDPVFPTSSGRRNTKDNVRAHIVNTARERANQLLAADDRPAIAHLTPHTLRRTFASMLAELEVPPRRAMYLLGHADPTLTMRVYQQVTDMGGDAPEQLERLIGSDLHDARQALSGRVVSRTKPERGASRDSIELP